MIALSRRSLLINLAAASLSSAFPRFSAAAAASATPLPLNVAARSPWMANQVALTRDNVMFLGLPRYAKDKSTPSLARCDASGKFQPFPGNAWNEWQPGKDGTNAFVYLNSVHMFADDTVWCVDQGSLSAGVFSAADAIPQPGAQKLVQLDARSGVILRILRFDETILPAGAQINDMRFHGSTLYLSDSGLGGIIVHDMQSGKTLRRLSGASVMKASAAKIPSILAHVKGGKTFHPPNSDLLEITADGKWLYWAAPTGPLYRIETRWLKDRSLTDSQLEQHVEQVYANNFAGGCCMDSRGNVYFSETVTGNITLLSPEGKTAVIASNPSLIRPDGTFISADRKLYIPVKQPIPDVSSPDTPFVIYSVALPESFAGIDIGDAVDGRA
ncbi:L-dopachrome tautomerase-related protein [Erwinia sp. S38]|uniref:L-dopachrome tautomerase-related protein n=1 Tax=Erwinia sp. S38 TaxID=2769338 RepID=UPI00190E5AD5|nr:L-dopachrome tautomerase-related protein [Erwinia sp. S38]MBK0003775.1 hypothetical protein [Erwinia sp. S38]